MSATFPGGELIGREIARVRYPGLRVYSRSAGRLGIPQSTYVRQHRHCICCRLVRFHCPE